MDENEELFSVDSVKEPEGPTKEELELLKNQEDEERRLAELQRRQRRDSIRALGFDVQESVCPHCHERGGLIIAEEGKRPAGLGLLRLLVPRLGNCGAVLHCFSCGRDTSLPGIRERLAVPALILLFMALIVAGDILLMKYLCTY